MKVMNQGQVISVNIGRPRQVEWRGRFTRTGIFKEPALGPVWIFQIEFKRGCSSGFDGAWGNQSTSLYLSIGALCIWERKIPDLQLPACLEKI
jgi:hypothetical protein